MEGRGGGCTCNSVAENGSQPGLCYYQFLPGYTEAVKSVPKPSKALETVPCMEALTILPRSNASKPNKRCSWPTVQAIAIITALQNERLSGYQPVYCLSPQ